MSAKRRSKSTNDAAANSGCAPSAGSPSLLPIVMKDLHTPVEPKQLHPMLLDDAYEGTIVAFDCRERMLTIQVDTMPRGKPGYRLGVRAILVFLPENDLRQARAAQGVDDTRD